MGHKLDKFILLMWKNFLLQWRHPLQTLVEILAPILFASLMVLLRSLVRPEVHPAAFYYPFENIMPNMSSIRTTLAWSPKNCHLEGIMNETVAAINTKLNTSLFKHRGLQNSEELYNYLDNELTLLPTLAGIRFNDSLEGDVELTPNMSIMFRFRGELRSGGILADLGFDRPDNWRTHQVFPVYQMPGPRARKRNEGGPPSYHLEGFLMLQQELSFSIINYFKTQIIGLPFNRSSVPIRMQRFPHPKYTEDMLLTALQVFVGLIFMLSFVYTCISTVRIITTEKEKQLKEAMKIMGLPNWLHWTAWFLKAFIMLTITLIIMVALLKAQWYPGTDYTVFTHSDPFALFVFLALFACATITFCFAISVFFSKANTAATIAGLAWFLSYIPYMFLQDQLDTLTLTQKLLTSLCSNTAMAYGFHTIVTFEGIGDGIQWYNIWRRTSPDNKLVLGHIMLMLLADSVIYFLIAIYVEAVFPGDYGVPQPWYFPVTPSYWCGKSSNVMDYCCDNPIENEFYEKEPTHLQAGIKIKQLRKQYSNKRVAVRDISLNMFKDQITVLLGHNGAGKTTTMSMLTGMFPPTAGTAVVGGHDIRTDLPGVRSSLGLCPQHNILFDELTVREHLYFYSRLKGLHKSRVDAEINKYVKLLDLEPKANSLSDTLSGGMKRKLSVGIALCGDSSVVMCDEPTAGMDPSARRVLWDLLQSQKKGRTILLSTHFMDEADLLGDRIAIMAGGNLQCCGSSFFLKKKYGAGYHLIMDKSPECDVGQVTSLLQKYIPRIQVENNIGSELTYILSEEYAAIFEKMLSELEEYSSSLGVLSYGVSLTTLEEVFMKVGADHGQEEANNATEANQRSHLTNGHGELNQGYQNGFETSNGHIKLTDFSQNTEENGTEIQATSQVNLNMGTSLLTGWALWRNQLLAMFMKRGLSILRTWMLFLIQILIPVLFLVLAIIIVKGTTIFRDLPNLKIELDRFADSVTVLSQYRTNEYYRQYIKYLQNDDKDFINWESQNLSMKMIEETEKNTTRVYQRYITGATFNEDVSITAWFSNQPYHAAPLALQMVLNAIFRAEVAPDFGLQFYNYPLPFTVNTQFEQLYLGNTMGFQIAFNIGFSMAFVSSFYIMFYVRERISKSKHLQFVSGAEVVSFWLPSFICDILTFVLTSIAIIITLAAFQEDGFRTAAELGRTFALLLCFGFAMLPMMYLASYFVDIPSTGYTRMTLINIFTGVAAFIVIEVLTTEELELQHVSDILHWVFLVVPHYSLSAGMRDMNLLYSTHKLCGMVIDRCTNFTLKPFPSVSLPPKLCRFLICQVRSECCKTTEDYFDMHSPGIGRNIVYSSSVGVALIIILLFIEYGAFEKMLYKIQNCKAPTPPVDMEEDGDVTKERQKIEQALSTGTIGKYNLAMYNVTKYYQKFLAVNRLSLGINEYECFGLLGVNGAGKTTTFKMMTGDIKLSSGDAWVNGLHIKTNMKKVHQLIGYCPQFDALLDDLSCKETLIIYGLLRGITLSESKIVAKQLSQQFDFHRHLNKQVKQLSGGNKRKLSTALALIGDPSVLYLDEPTTGMDPATKRYLWNALCKVRDSGKCIVLTSHSMEECEALCTRLAIMVNGVFKCLGSTQHLKSKFSEGYTLTIKVRKTENHGEQHSEVELIEKFVKDNFRGATIREKHHELITFYITDRSQPWSKMFGIMERGKVSLNIEDYSLGQSTLEQVFLTFTKQQRDV